MIWRGNIFRMRPPVRSRHIRPVHVVAAALLAMAGFVGLAQEQGTELQGVATVIDGDTLEIRGQRIRLHGIDAPESGQTCKDVHGVSYRCGQRAALALADRIGRGTVICKQRDTDRYGRMVAVCMIGGLDLNAWMVRAGHALAYRKYSTDYVGEETQARRDRKGMWTGSFAAPWDWRRSTYRPAPVPKEKKKAAPKTAARKCNIKGSSSRFAAGDKSPGRAFEAMNGRSPNRRGGARIYHVPGQEYYTATRISPGKGERWFCSEAEARAAGWRRARR